MRKLTRGPGRDSHPDWSPRGGRIAFARSVAGRKSQERVLSHRPLGACVAPDPPHRSAALPRRKARDVELLAVEERRVPVDVTHGGSLEDAARARLSRSAESRTRSRSPKSAAPAGRYVLVHRANPQRAMRELRYSDDAASVLLRVIWPSGTTAAPRVSVLRRCETSERCPPP